MTGRPTVYCISPILRGNFSNSSGKPTWLCIFFFLLLLLLAGLGDRLRDQRLGEVDDLDGNSIEKLWLE